MGQPKCSCGRQIRKGDGRKWGDAEDDEVCLACAGQWQIDSIEVAHGTDSHKWDVDQRGEPIRKSRCDLRVRPICSELGEVRSVHNPTDSFDIANAVKFDCSLPVPCIALADSPRCWKRRRRGVWGRPQVTGRQSREYTCVGRQHVCSVQKRVGTSDAACGRIGSSS